MDMPDRRQTLIEVFEDTQRYYSENSFLIDAVKWSRDHTVLYPADAYPELPISTSLENLYQTADDDYASLGVQAAAVREIEAIQAGAPYDPKEHMGEVRLTKHKTFEAAMKLHEEFPDKRIAVLNFASAVRPGGGVKSGSSAQEESLCRCSTLFPTIDRRWLWQQFYDVNRAAQNPTHTDDCIYSPGIVICKTDESVPQRLDPKDFVSVDVISCAAPNLAKKTWNIHNPEASKGAALDYYQQADLHDKRARHILHIAAFNRVDILVLGAFGCGAFANDPESVALGIRRALKDYSFSFDVIEFAIYCRPGETKNYDAFQNEFCSITK